MYATVYCMYDLWYVPILVQYLSSTLLRFELLRYMPDNLIDTAQRESCDWVRCSPIRMLLQIPLIWLFLCRQSVEKSNRKKIHWVL